MLGIGGIVIIFLVTRLTILWSPCEFVVLVAIHAIGGLVFTDEWVKFVMTLVICGFPTGFIVANITGFRRILLRSVFGIGRVIKILFVTG